MDSFVDERDYGLLQPDRYTFFILRRIMGGHTELLLSDHEKLIICFTGHPYPVWIWIPDNARDEDMERAYRIVKENGFMSGRYHFNVKYALAQYFIERAEEDGIKLKITMNMFTYDCPDPVEPKIKADGGIYPCGTKDTETLVSFLDMFHKDTGIDKKDIREYRSDAKAYIESGNIYFWKDINGSTAAVCKYVPDGDMASINLVFTHPQLRRKHYAENLVYQVTKTAIKEGYLPMLYTDADYAASNACYEKIGYIMRGRLCTIGQ